MLRLELKDVYHDGEEMETTDEEEEEGEGKEEEHRELTEEEHRQQWEEETRRLEASTLLLKQLNQSPYLRGQHKPTIRINK